MHDRERAAESGAVWRAALLCGVKRRRLMPYPEWVAEADQTSGGTGEVTDAELEALIIERRRRRPLPRKRRHSTSIHTDAKPSMSTRPCGTPTRNAHRPSALCCKPFWSSRRRIFSIQSLEARAKSIESFGDKAVQPSPQDPNKPKYSEPLGQITDLAGARVITFLLDAVDQVNEIIEKEFEIVEKSTRSGLMEEGEKLGYQSVHFLVKFSDARCDLPEYARFKDLVTEIQVRTILQHAWAEIEHDIQYKAVEAIPRFNSAPLYLARGIGRDCRSRVSRDLRRGSEKPACGDTAH